MYRFEISKLLSKDPSVYKSFTLLDIDALPNKIKCHRFIIVNILNHWICIHRNVYGPCEIFDSLGEKSNCASIVLKLKRIRLKASVFYTKTQLQPQNSVNCGRSVSYT